MSQTPLVSNSRQQILLRMGVDRMPPLQLATVSITSKFEENTFNDRVMRERLPKDVYRKLCDTIRKGFKLDMTIADSVAHAMKEWAISKGVSHFTHWFQPQTGLTAEKHDAFLELDGNNMVERFRGNHLVQGEPDASSFPSGGARSTFEARGYTMWDPSSPAFIMEGPKGGILCVPSVFISYTGEALDKKTPLIRSMHSINDAALRVLRLFGNTSATRVTTTLGTEQEYFLIDKAFYNLRPDLQITGRTLQGAQPPKGQQMDDHYFGAIKERVLAFMQDVEEEYYKLGIPAKTRHNEVAPHQYEVAPIFSESNVGADRNQIMMEVLKKVANRHGLAVLMHEKPFAGINGSGKHNNWSMQDSDGRNLLDPGDTPEKNLQFLFFLIATLKAVHRYGDLLRMSVASAGNDHRLGANEAPPAIMSVFLGERLNTILDDLKEGRKSRKTEDYIIDLGVSNLPSIFRDYTDRNRTSPFAFTGQKFEFRAVGSSASVSLANTVLSAAVAESSHNLCDQIETKMQGGADLNDAVLAVLQQSVRETETVRFEGNNYDRAWENEAEKRGLPNVKRTGYALDALVDLKNIKMLIDQKVFTEKEIRARYNIKLEQYITTLEIEAEAFCDLIETRVLPAALNYQNQLAQTVASLVQVEQVIAGVSIEPQKKLLKAMSEQIDLLMNGVKQLKEIRRKADTIDDLSKQARFVADQLVDALETVRKPADELERLVPDAEWPLPKYQEMLFIM
ncbi:MAG: glutamine synthetase III [candidate division KSB1 bacterium]|nr:glutamine synthetase III [candidate division KSB1 bacterium]